jgi:hypothetical protein
MYGKVETGPGVWRFNLETLTRLDHLGEALAEDLDHFIIEGGTDLPLAAERWDALKGRLRQRLVQLNWRAAANDDSRSPARVAQAAALEARLPPTDYNSTGLRARLRQTRAQAIIAQLQTDAGTLSSKNEIVAEAARFYSDLFAQRSSPASAAGLEARQTLLDGLQLRLPQGKRDQLEGLVTLDELTDVRDACKRKKAPGPDGTPIEIYFLDELWDVLGPYLLDALHEAERELHILPPSLRTAHIHLAHKTGDRDRLSNYRPISTINTDLKIKDMADARRLLPVLHYVISLTQVGSIPERQIDDNILLIQSLFDDDDAEGYLAILDCPKAYDRVDHDFLLAVMAAMGFGPRFIERIEISLRGRRASVMINGFESVAIPLEAGMPQGGPNACALFAIAVAPMLDYLAGHLQGVAMAALVLRERAFADDTAAALRNADDLRTLLRAVRLHEAASGALLNTGKSVLQELGRPAPDLVLEARAALPPDLTIQRSTFRYLGVTCGYGVDADTAWAPVLAKVRRRLLGIPMFDLPISTRCRILNTFIFPMIYFLDRFLPAPREALAALDALQRTALWGGKRVQAGQAILWRKPAAGGFGLTNLRRQLASNRAERARALCFGPVTLPILQRRRLIQNAVSRAEPIVTIHGLRRAAPLVPGELAHAKTFRWSVAVAMRARGLQLDHPAVIAALVQACRGPWQVFLDAFLDAAKFRPPPSPEAIRGLFLISVEDPPSLQRSVDRTLFKVDRSREGTFAQGNRRWVDALPVLRISGWDKRVPGASDWKVARSWRPLKALHLARPDVADTYLLFRHFQLLCADKYVYRDRQRPWTAHTLCPLCEAHPETRVHLMSGCVIVNDIWLSVFSPLPQPSLSNLLLLDKSDIPLSHLASFVHLIWRTRQGRRYSRTPPDDIVVGDLATELRRLCSVR